MQVNTVTYVAFSPLLCRLIRLRLNNWLRNVNVLNSLESLNKTNREIQQGGSQVAEK
jgi:hypothetical protein